MSEEQQNVPATPAAGEQSKESESTFDRFVYHQRRAMEEAGKAVEALLPEGFRTHAAEASKEFEKGVKVLVDAAITELEKLGQRAQQVGQQPAAEGDDGTEEAKERLSTTGKVKVKVQVE